jgi:hypothetical protein
MLRSRKIQPRSRVTFLEARRFCAGTAAICLESAERP